VPFTTAYEAIIAKYAKLQTINLIEQKKNKKFRGETQKENFKI